MNKWQVHFVRNKISGYKVKFGDIYVYQPTSNWNDFSYKIRCQMLIKQENGRVFESELFLGFLPVERSSLFFGMPKNGIYFSLDQVLKSTHDPKAERYSSTQFPSFFTLLPNMQAYRSLVQKMGQEQAKEILTKINDLVVYKSSASENKWYDNAINSDVFRLGFMRNSEPFFTFHNADSVLAGAEEESFEAISQSLNLSFKLSAFNNEHILNLRFSRDGVIPKRINILIGKNGTGKSRALNQFCRAALQYKDAKEYLEDPDIELDRPLINRLLAIGTPGETGNTFPGERISTQKLFYRRLNLSRNSRAGASRGMGEMLVQLARNEDCIGDERRWKIFTSALEQVLPITQLALKSKDGEPIKLISLGRSGGEESSLMQFASVSSNTEPLHWTEDGCFPLSSGHLTFFKFAVLCCLYIENGSFILMDEPETHFHPNLIADFVHLLDSILESTGSQAIIATHSAYFVREVAREQVHVFKEENGNIFIGPPRLKTFGADVDSISQFVFEENTESRLTAKIFERVKGRNFNEVDRELRNELSLTALMDLRRRMESCE